MGFITCTNVPSIEGTTASLTPAAAVEIPDELDAAIRLHVRRVYEKCNNNLYRAAAALKAARNTVRKYLEEA